MKRADKLRYTTAGTIITGLTSVFFGFHAYDAEHFAERNNQRVEACADTLSSTVSRIVKLEDVSDKCVTSYDGILPMLNENGTYDYVMPTRDVLIESNEMTPEQVEQAREGYVLATSVMGTLAVGGFIYRRSLKADKETSNERTYFQYDIEHFEHASLDELNTAYFSLLKRDQM